MGVMGEVSNSDSTPSQAASNVKVSFSTRSRAKIRGHPLPSLLEPKGLDWRDCK